jgi:hypothetical protein
MKRISWKIIKVMLLHLTQNCRSRTLLRKWLTSTATKRRKRRTTLCINTTKSKEPFFSGWLKTPVKSGLTKNFLPTIRNSTMTQLIYLFGVSSLKT